MIGIINSLRIKSVVKVKRLNMGVIVSLLSTKLHFFFYSLVILSNNTLKKIKLHPKMTKLPLR